MGYRSNVAYRITGPTDSVMREVALFLLKGDIPWVKEALEECTINKHEDGAILGFEGYGKWYKGYEDVDAHEAIWDRFYSLESDGFSGAFIRIGEDDDDVETRYFGDDPYDLITLSRSYETVPLDTKADLRSTLESQSDQPQGQ